MKSLLGLSRSLFHDVKRLHPDVTGLDRDLRSIEARFKNESQGYLSLALSSFGKAFDQGLASGRLGNIWGFRKVPNGSIPTFLQGMTSKVFDTKTGTLLEEPSVECILSIRQICYFFKKTLPSHCREEKLSRRAINAFMRIEDEIVDHSGPRLDRFIHVCSFLTDGLDKTQDHKCKHGPGAVLEGYTVNQKWSAVYRGLLERDRRLLLAGYDLPASMLDVDPPWGVGNEPGVSPVEESIPKDDLEGPCARLVTVPKSYSALRTITVEPCLNQFVQQGLNETLRVHIAKHPILRKCLTLDSQTPNQELALEGSLSGDWSTVDLSSASDRMSLQLVEAAFSHSEHFLKVLLACRTPRIKLGTFAELELKKFAGMGNATTFPIQSLVYAAVAISAILESEHYLTTEKIRRAASCVRVFGDDIIIRTQHFQAFADWITSLGFEINQGKTFSEGNFRESCGVDAFDGYNVTPVYLRRDPEDICSDPSAVVSLVATSNELWMRCYYETSDFIKDNLDRFKDLPYVSSEAIGLGWKTRQNVVTCQRWARDLQRWEHLTFVPESLEKPDNLEGYPALQKFYHHPLIGRDDEDHLKASKRRYSLRLRRRWVAAY